MNPWAANLSCPVLARARVCNGRQSSGNRQTACSAHHNLVSRSGAGESCRYLGHSWRKPRRAAERHACRRRLHTREHIENEVGRSRRRIPRGRHRKVGKGRRCEPNGCSLRSPIGQTQDQFFRGAGATLTTSKRKRGMPCQQRIYGSRARLKSDLSNRRLRPLFQGPDDPMTSAPSHYPGSPLLRISDRSGRPE